MMMMMMVMIVIFIYCNWVFAQCQWSVNLYKNRTETAQKGNNTKHKIENKNTKQKQTQKEY